MKIGLALEDCIADTTTHFELWKKRTGFQGDSYLDPKLIRDESFWASMPCFTDVVKFLNFLNGTDIRLYIISERSSKLFLITRSWLYFKGFQINQQDLILNAIKRYDCRLHMLDYYIDTDQDLLDKFEYDPTRPLLLDRNNGSFGPIIQFLGEKL